MVIKNNQEFAVPSEETHALPLMASSVLQKDENIVFPLHGYTEVS
jgi:hypothetical protein